MDPLAYETLILAAVLGPEGRACIGSAGTLAIVGEVQQTETSIQGVFVCNVPGGAE